MGDLFDLMYLRQMCDCLFVCLLLSLSHMICCSSAAWTLRLKQSNTDCVDCSASDRLQQTFRCHLASIEHENPFLTVPFVSFCRVKRCEFVQFII